METKTDGSAESRKKRFSDLKILEIGEQALFKMGWPAQTDFFVATWHAVYADRWDCRILGPLELARVFLRVWRGDYDLVVLHPPHYPFWHPRSLAATFKFTVLKGRPLRFPSTLFSTFAFPLLRFLPKCRMVAVDMSDHFSVQRHHIFVLDRVRYYFKRELPVDKWNVFYRTCHRSLPTRNFRSKPNWQRRIARLRPIGLATMPDVIEGGRRQFGLEKKTDIFFAGQVENTSTVRSEGIVRFIRLAERGVVIDIPDGPIPRDEFQRRCAQAWLTWSPAGYGWDCGRHVEASAAGSVVVVNAPTISRYAPMRHGEQCFFYNPDEEDGLERAVTEALADKPKLAEMAVSANRHVLAHYTPDALCGHIAGLEFGEG